MDQRQTRNPQSITVPNNPFKAISSTRLTQLNKLASEKSGIPGIIKKCLKKWIEYRASSLQNHGKASHIQVSIKNHGTFNANECNGQICVTYLDHYKSLYEPEIEAIIETYVHSIDAFIDCGANWGYFTGKVILSKPDIKCWAIEPSEVPFEDLERMIKALGPREKIQLIKGGASSSETIFSIAQSTFDSGTNHLVQLDASATTTNEIKCFPIDILNPPAKSLVKIDVEGHELEVLKGMRSLLQKQKCTIIFEHWHTDADALNPFVEYLSEFNFTIYEINTDIDKTSRPHQTSMKIHASKPALETGGRYNLLAIHASRIPFNDFNEQSNENN